MKVTIEGDLEQVASVIAPGTSEKPRARKGSGCIAKRNAQIAAEASALGRAFKQLRHRPESKDLADEFLAALVGRAERTKSIMDKAHQVLAGRSH